MNKRHSLGIRKMVLEMYRDGYPVEKILQKSKVSRSRMYALVREAVLPHRKQKRHEQHTSANEADISSISLKEKKKIIDQFQISKNKSAFATEHHIPRSTLYNWSNNDIFPSSSICTTGIFIRNLLPLIRISHIPSAPVPVNDGIPLFIQPHRAARKIDMCYPAFMLQHHIPGIRNRIPDILIRNSPDHSRSSPRNNPEAFFPSSII